MNSSDQEEIKRALKEALKEWLDEKFLLFGKWTAMGFGAWIFAGLIYLILQSNGWHHVIQGGK